MSENDPTPVIALAFANDQGEHLAMIKREQQSVAQALESHEDRRYIKVHKEESTTIEEVFALFNRYAGRIAIFHYGGHASGSFLQLETPSGQAELAHAGGLAQLMGRERGLQLVFLNGCATRGQVQTLLSRGVKAVIATAVKINDAMATEFAEQFYRKLAKGGTIAQSFEIARDFVATRYGTDRSVGEFRGMSWAGKEEAVEPALVWGLYVNDNGDEALNWTLPDKAEHQVIFQRAPASATVGDSINAGLVETLVNEVLRHSKDASADWQRYVENDEANENSARRVVLEAFPAPVSEQLRKVFSGDTVDEARLRQLLRTYDTIAKLFSFALLSQLWNVRHENPALAIDKDASDIVNAFVNLTKDTHASFDHFQVVRAVVRIFRAHQIKPFMPECAEFETSLADDSTRQAHGFMEQLSRKLLGPLAEKEVESLCVDAETHLGVLLSDFVYIVNYKLATIKGINTIKSRHKAPAFQHIQLTLDKGYGVDSKDIPVARSFSTDSQSVILLPRKDAKDGDGKNVYLNLSPFIIDENAFTGSKLSKLYYFSHRDPATGNCFFRLVSNATELLEITGKNYPWVKSEFDEFARAMRTP